MERALPRPGLLSLVFFLSGAAALCFETVWFRLAGLTFGNSVRAATLVLTSFMAGLALGNAVAARLGDRVRRPLLAYALIEVVIGVTGFLLVVLFPEFTPRLRPLLSALAATPYVLDAARLALAGLMLLVPTAAMGVTLPLMLRAVASVDSSYARELGRLYGWNTLGAVAGALLGETLLIRWLGLRGTGCAAGLLSLTAALLAVVLARRSPASVAAAGEAAPVQGRLPWRLLAAAFVSGSILLSLEVVWYRLLLPYVLGTSLAFALMLAVVLAGIAAGGFLGSLRVRRAPLAHRELPLIALAASAWVVIGYASFDAVAVFGNRLVHEPASVAALAAWLMFPGSLLSGLLFTLMGAALHVSVGFPARTTGWLTLANTLGAACGAVAGGLLLLPVLGVERSFFVLALAYAAVAVLCHVEVLRPGRLLAGAALVALLLAIFPFGLMRGRHLQAIAERFGFPAMQIAAVREGVSETIVYLRRDLWGRPHHYQLVTNGFSMSGSPLSAKRYMKQYVYWPMAVNPRIRRALLICYGVGSTAKALTDTRALQSIDIVDLSSDVLDLARVVYPRAGESPLDDPRVRRHVEDGRYFLETSGERYDLITGEPPPPKAAGVVSLYSREYFALVRERLAPGGVVTYWLPVYQMLGGEARAIIRAFCDVFETCSLWTGGGTTWMLAGTRDALPRVSEEDFSAQWRDPQVAAEMRAVGFDSPELLSATFLGDAAFLKRLVSADAPLVDDFPLRLSPATAERPDPQYAEILDPDGARRRFEQSDYIRRLWPPEIRERTLSSFEIQRLLNVRFFGAEGPRLWFAEAASLLTGPPRLPALTLWLLDSDQDEVRMAAEARARGVDDGYLEYKLGVAALLSRDATTAEGHFARALQRDPRQRFLTGYRALALCLAGKGGEAVAAAEDKQMQAWLARGACPSRSP